MTKRKITKNPVSVTFVKVDHQSRRRRQTAAYRATGKGAQTPVVEERALESLWHDIKPEGWNFLDWHRAWNNGYPEEEHVELYNALHPAEEQIALIDEDDDA